MTTAKLSSEDVSRLVAERSTEARIETATKLAVQFRKGELTDKERQLAEEIFRVMVRDAETRVREAIAVNLKEANSLPHDVAVSLAHDVDSVALPILQFSKVLTDNDLIQIVRGHGTVKQVAIARRPDVSSSVSDALVETKSAPVVQTLVANAGADLSENSITAIVDEFGTEPGVQESLIQRPKLPIGIAERLLNMVSDQMRDQLVARHKLHDEALSSVVAQSRERATITLVAGATRDDVEGLVRHLNTNGRLTPSIILRAVCMGDMAFFAAGMAERASVPLINTQMLIEDPGRLGFKALYDKASMPKPLYPAFRCALDVERETQFDGGEMDRERYSRRMIERILSQYDQLGVAFESSDMEYLLAKMSQLPPSTAAADPA